MLLVGIVASVYGVYQTYNLAHYIYFWARVPWRRPMLRPLLRSYALSWLMPPFIFGRFSFVPFSLIEEMLALPVRPVLYRNLFFDDHIEDAPTVTLPNGDPRVPTDRKALRDSLGKWFASGTPARFSGHFELWAREDFTFHERGCAFFLRTTDNVFTRGTTQQPFDTVVRAAARLQRHMGKGPLLLRATYDLDVKRMLAAFPGVVLLAPPLFRFDHERTAAWAQAKRDIFLPILAEHPGADRDFQQRLHLDFVAALLSMPALLLATMYQLSRPHVAADVELWIAEEHKAGLLSFVFECLRVGNKTSTLARRLHNFRLVCYTDGMSARTPFDHRRFLDHPEQRQLGRYFGAGGRECPAQGLVVQYLTRFVRELVSDYRVEFSGEANYEPRDFACFGQGVDCNIRLVPRGTPLSGPVTGISTVG